MIPALEPVTRRVGLWCTYPSHHVLSTGRLESNTCNFQRCRLGCLVALGPWTQTQQSASGIPAGDLVRQLGWRVHNRCGDSLFYNGARHPGRMALVHHHWILWSLDHVFDILGGSRFSAAARTCRHGGRPCCRPRDWIGDDDLSWHRVLHLDQCRLRFDGESFARLSIDVFHPTGSQTSREAARALAGRRGSRHGDRRGHPRCCERRIWPPPAYPFRALRRVGRSAGGSHHGGDCR